ncbi:4'-phosphopantetheinyl transferase family protein [Aliterella atlantica]|uniref:Uncharacterized protein n=1 Tax=Aliterella atlantica CENA595 TaxID=1618023 RepID=A0A0D8ZWD3_9CYAN|nr:4'-phosphopantetheinyl transferase superfamily protein [Aliterella atlantica]KJH72734.1 hypothetical protein UH38_03965 [Aliterella atlantica CENA595]
MVTSKVDLMWQMPPQKLSLSQSEVHIWRVFLDRPAGSINQLAQTLSADEYARAERFYFERDKNRFIVARAALRAILGSYLSIAADKVQFCYGHRGKPALAQTHAQSRLCFNLSHSEELAVCAITRDREVGVDVEFIRPITEAEQIAKRYFSARENASFQALPNSDKQAGFFYHWTRKEAYLKAEGEGLSANCDRFDASVASEEAKIQGTGDRWFLQGFTPAPNYIATVAVEGKGWEVTYWQIPL